MRTRSGIGPAAAVLSAALVAGCTGGDAADQTVTTAAVTTAAVTTEAVTTEGVTTEGIPVPSASAPASPAIPEATPPSPTDRTGLPEVVTVTGTVQAGVESGCVLLDGLLLIGGSPEVLQPGNQVTVTGRLDPGMVTFCQQGIPLIVTSAEEAR